MPLNIFDGSNWNPFKKIQIHDGTSWNESKAAHIWNGSEWKIFSTGVPTNTEAPVFSQSVIGGGVEQTVSVSTGIWDNSPTSYRYVWEVAQYSNAGFNNWTPLYYNGVAQTESSAYVDLTHVGYTIRAKVYAINASGESSPYTVTTGMIFGPSALPFLTAYVVSSGRVYMLWEKSKGANGYTLQYQGPNVPFTELTLQENNQEPGTDVGQLYGNKYLDFGPTTSGSLVIGLFPFSSNNPLSNAIPGVNLSGPGKNATINELRTLRAPVLNTPTISRQPAQVNAAASLLTVSVSFADAGEPAASLSYSWTNGSATNTSTVADDGTTQYCTVTATNSQGSDSKVASYTVPGVTLQPPVASASTSLVYFGGTSWQVNGSYSNSGGAATSTNYYFVSAGYPGTQWNTQTYVIDPNDYGRNITFYVTLSNAAGSSSAQSATTGPNDPVGPLPPFFPPSFKAPFFPPAFAPVDPTPPFFPPSFKAPFFPPAFEPVPPFFPPSFKAPFFPPAFTFAPPAFEPVPPFFPPSFKAPFFPPTFFDPPAFFSPPSFSSKSAYKCLAPETQVFTKSGWKFAKDINIGDTLITISDNVINNDLLMENKSMINLPQNVEFKETTVYAVAEKSEKLISFNNGGKNISIKHPVFVKNDTETVWKHSEDVQIGDALVKIDPSGSVSYTIVDSIEIDESASKVYDIRTSGIPWFITKDLLVIA